MANSGPQMATDDHPGMNDIFSDAAFDPARALHSTPREKQKSTKQGLRDNLKHAARVLAHPKSLVRNKVTDKAASKLGDRHPEFTEGHDKDLLDEHDKIADAASIKTDDSADFQEVAARIDEAQDRLNTIQQRRESLQTAWILGRHVNRVKVVRPGHRPDRAHFKTPKRFEWEHYVAKLALYYSRNFTSHLMDDFASPPFDLEDFARLIERIAITSAPWQTLFMNVREIYTWEQPRRTARWLALFCVLWYFQYIGAYFYFWIIYMTIRNRFREQSVQTVRDSVRRAFDREARIQAWGDLIQHHGKEEWLEPFLNDVGPIVQLQLGDLADLLEILINFYRWERPKLTYSTMFFYSCCLTICLCADMDFCVKLVWLICGGAFFLTYPLATNFPKYRLVLSPWRWAFWGVPTHAELAILTLQEKIAVREKDLAEFDYCNESEGNIREDVGGSYNFKVYGQTQGKGELLVNRYNLSLSISSTKEQTWQYTEIDELRKLDDIDVDATNAVKNLARMQTRSLTGLEILRVDGGRLTLLLPPSDRDRVFNLILAWSGLKWQSLKIERHNNPDSQRSNLDRAVKRALH
jgi:hypothetical protein